jgi:hypothetical protein
MTLYESGFSSRNTRTRRCAGCNHLNPASHLTCQNCNATLRGSEWVVMPERDSLPDEGGKTIPIETDIESPTGRDLTIPQYADKPSTRPAISAAMIEKLRRAAGTIGEIDGGTIHVGSMTQKFREGTAVFESSMMLVVAIDKTPTPLSLRLPQKRPFIFGRDDAQSPEKPDIDLIPYGGFRLGISRRHAALELNGKRLAIRDLKSSNGTFLNAVRIDPFEDYQLRDGDEIRLGSMIMTIHFKV